MARPEIVKTQLAQRLRRVRLEAGDPARDTFAQVLGLSPKTLANYERGDTQPDAEALAAYRRELGIDTNWIVSGDGDLDLLATPKLKALAEIAAANGKVSPGLAGLLAIGGGADYETVSQISGQPVQSGTTEIQNMIPLPFYQGVHASAGVGLMPQAHVQADSVVSFDERFLRDKGAAPDRCNVITARGDSMAPTIPDGSLLVVDHSQTQVGNGYIMVINLGDDLLVKRVHRRIDGLIDLISDNPAYPRETIGGHMLDQLRVVGRVVYFCRVP